MTREGGREWWRRRNDKGGRERREDKAGREANWCSPTHRSGVTFS